MIKLTTFTKSVFIITFTGLSASLLNSKSYNTLLFFIAIFSIGALIRNKEIFWKLCLGFFGILSIILLFAMFDGLEPNRPGVFSRGDWFSLDFFLFVMLIFSTIMSCVAGLQAGKARDSKLIGTTFPIALMLLVLIYFMFVGAVNWLRG